ncbi:hypothetical protein [Streptomyces avermitilis]|uniref:hypothetical protein n=1 Tax=Streptomyces avermitilis TaxID=33903 RepID=UPI0036787DCF
MPARGTAQRPSGGSGPDRRWGATVNSATPVVVDGAIEDAGLRQRLGLLGEQAVGFAHARRG